MSLIFLLAISARAQDAVLISEGNFVRGLIKGTNFESVFIEIEDQGVKEYKAKDVRSFLWNGDTYESKPLIINKKALVLFLKLEEGGKINLYSLGSTSEIETPNNYRPQTKRKPSIGISMGAGGMGSGIGVSIGGGSGNIEPETRPITKIKVQYYLEKPGTGPIQEIFLDAKHLAGAKNLLLQKIGDDDGLAESIRQSNNFDEKIIFALVKSYNAAAK